jgi:hypothetical protein
LYAASYDPPLNVVPGGAIQSAPAFVDPGGGRPPRINQWNVSLQREVTKDLVFEAAYVGNRGAWFNAPGLININAINPEALLARGIDVTSAADRTLLTSSISSATAQARGIQKPYAGFPNSATVAQSLRPYPQYGDIGAIWTQLGNTWYDALQVKATKRYSFGLDFLVSYAWSKNLATANDGTGTTVPINNVFNRQNQKVISNLDQPHLLTVSYNYVIPQFGFMKTNRFARTALSGWTIGGILTYSSGLPIQAPNSNNGLSSAVYQSTFQNRVPGVPLFQKDLNCHCVDPTKQLVLNPAAWTDAAPGTFGNAAAFYSDYRYQRRPVESMSIGKRFTIKERIAFSIRAEFFNVFNRLVLPNPSTSNPQATPTYNAQGLVTGGFGYINPGQITSNSVSNSLPAPRTGQLVARFDF